MTYIILKIETRKVGLSSGNAHFQISGCRLERWPTSALADYYLRDTVLVMVLSVIMCPSHAGILSKWLRASSLFFAYGLPSTYATLCFREIRL